MRKEYESAIYITILNFVEVGDRAGIVFIYRMTKERELESVVKAGRQVCTQPPFNQNFSPTIFFPFLPALL